MSETPFYRSGGTLAGDAPSYVIRQADADLLDALLSGEFCYVLTSRQMGKSSLVSRCRLELRERKVRQAVLDLQRFGTNLSVEQWYNGLISALAEDLDLEDEVEDFLDEHEKLSPHQRWIACLREVILEELDGKVVIFIDEIDMVRALPFGTDEFFAGIREVFNRRASDPVMERLTFCLLGVASPADLIHDKRITPFNIGRRIELLDFKSKEMDVFAMGLANHGAEESTRIVERVFHWTSGQPYLSQRLCQDVAELVEQGSVDVDAVCQQRFLSKKGREGDANLTFVRDRLLVTPEDREPMLQLLKRVVRKQTVPDDPSHVHLGMLKLSGAVKVVDGNLAVKNRIYGEVFDTAFVKQHMPVNWQRITQRAALWLGGVFLFACLPVAIWALHQRSLARQELVQSEKNFLIARKELIRSQENYDKSLDNVVGAIDATRHVLQREGDPWPLQQVMDGLDEAFKAQPNHERKRYVKARLQVSMGEVRRRKGEHDKAEVLFRESAETLRDLYHGSDADAEYGMELGASLNALGTLYMRDLKGDGHSSGEIRALFEESVGVNREVRSKNRMGPWLYSISLEHLADLEIKLKRYDAALSLLHESLPIRQEMVEKKRETKNLDYLNNTHTRLGRAYEGKGDVEDAAEAFEASAKAMAEAADIDAKNSNWSRSRAGTLQTLARLYEQHKLPEKQRLALRRSVDVWSKLSLDFPTDTRILTRAAGAMQHLAKLTEDPAERDRLEKEERKRWRSLDSAGKLSPEQRKRLETLDQRYRL